MQLIIEYMLNAQNAQLNAIIDKSQQIKSLIHANKKLEIDKLKLKENLKSAEHSMVASFLSSCNACIISQSYSKQIVFHP